MEIMLVIKWTVNSDIHAIGKGWKVEYWEVDGQEMESGMIGTILRHSISFGNNI